MRTLLFLFIFSIQLYAQDSIEVMISNTQTKFSAFERELMQTVINLYNKKYEPVSHVKFTKINEFKAIFERLGDKHYKEKNLFGINSISVTKKRQKLFKFSRAYMPNKYSLLSNKDFLLDESKMKNYKIAYITESVFDHQALLKKYPCKIISYHSYKDRVQDLFDKKIDMILTDYVDLWAYDLKLIEILDFVKTDSYALIYKTESQFSKRFVYVFNYFTGSKKYYALIKKHFGDNAVTYFRNNL